MDRKQCRRMLLWCGGGAVMLGACAPTVTGLFVAGSGGGGSTTVVNPTLAVIGPGTFHNSATANFSASTTPPGLGLEAALDGAGFVGVGSTWSYSGLIEDAHSVRVRIAGAPTTEQTMSRTVDTTAPTAVTGLALATKADGEVSLSWNAGSDAGSGLDYYDVEYGTVQGGVRTQNTVVPAPASGGTLTGLSTCTTYYLTVTTVDRAGNRSSATTELRARASCGGDGTFAASDLTLGTGPSQIAKGDFNSDGILDLAVDEGSTLRILYGDGTDGRGNGAFTTGPGIAVGSGIADIAVADIDADHIDDILVLNQTQLRVYQGQGSNGVGDGTFSLASSTSSNLSSPFVLCVGDVDADAIPDVVVGNWGTDTLVTLKGGGSGGRGNGTFSFVASIATGSRPGAIATGDFNADGITDLAVACQNSGDVVVTHLGNGASGRGNGTFAAKQSWLSGGFVGGGVAVADFDRDGIQDLVVTLALGNIVAFLQGLGSDAHGTGGFVLVDTAQTETRPWGIVAAEFDGDGIADYAVVSVLDHGTTLIHAASGATEWTSTNVGGFVRALECVAGDVDGNGSTDIVIADINGGITVLQNHGRKGIGDGQFPTVGDDLFTVGDAYGLLTTDIHNDGVPDIMVTGFASGSPANGLVSGFECRAVDGLGTGAFDAGLIAGCGAGPRALAAGDFDADRIPDLAVVATNVEAVGGGDLVDIFIGAGSSGSGSGGFGLPASVAVGAMPRAIVTGDFDRDGILDLAVASEGSGSVTVLLGQGSGGRGNGTFVAQSPITTSVAPQTLVCADFTKDGILDLAIGTANGSTGELQVLVGQGSNGVGNGTFTANAATATPFCITSLAVGDFDGDGILDLASANFRPGGGTLASGVTIWTGNGSGGRGDGTFTAGAEIAIGGNAKGIVAADFTGDRVLDLAVSDADTAQFFVLSGNGSSGRGDGTFSLGLAWPVDAVAESIATADLNSDGVFDVITVGDDRITVRFGSGVF